MFPFLRTIYPKISQTPRQDGTHGKSVTWKIDIPESANPLVRSLGFYGNFGNESDGVELLKLRLRMRLEARRHMPYANWSYAFPVSPAM